MERFLLMNIRKFVRQNAFNYRQLSIFSNVLRIEISPTVENTVRAGPGALKSPLPRPFNRGNSYPSTYESQKRVSFENFLQTFQPILFLYRSHPPSHSSPWRFLAMVAIPRSGDRARSNAYGAERRPEVPIVLVIQIGDYFYHWQPVDPFVRHAVRV